MSNVKVNLGVWNHEARPTLNYIISTHGEEAILTLYWTTSKFNSEI
jgi:hypothetical protein